MRCDIFTSTSSIGDFLMIRAPFYAQKNNIAMLLLSLLIKYILYWNITVNNEDRMNHKNRFLRSYLNKILIEG